MDPAREHIHHCLLYEYNKQGENKNASQAARDINSVYGTGTVAEKTARDWFMKFKNGDTSLEEGHRSGRHDSFEDEELEEVLAMNPWATQEEIAELLGVTQQDISFRLHRLGKVSKTGRLVTKDLTFHQKLERGIICRINLSRFERNPRFLNHLIVVDETPVYLQSSKKKHAWVDPKQPAPFVSKPSKSKKFSLVVFFDVTGMLYFELLEQGESEDTAKYGTQLRELHDSLPRKRPKKRKVIVLHDNYKPHVNKDTMAIFREFGWEMILHPGYSPDCNPADYAFNRFSFKKFFGFKNHFRGLKTHLKGKIFENRAALEKEINGYINSKEGTNFYHDAIHELPTRWNYIYDHEGNYYPD